MVRRKALTPAGVDSLEIAHLVDPQTPGLWIKAGAKGKKTWRYRRRLGQGDVVKLTRGG